jgi:AAA15 family ATPase/GTPase
MSSATEFLKIRNFFSIKEFDWDIKGFNVITGGMGAGKSLCLKLLYFFERSLDVSILSPSLDSEYFLRLFQNPLMRIEKARET